MEVYMIHIVFLAVLTDTGLFARNSTPGMLPVMTEEARARERATALTTGVDDAAGSQTSGWTKQPFLLPLLDSKQWNIIWSNSFSIIYGEVMTHFG